MTKMNHETKFKNYSIVWSGDAPHALQQPLRIAAPAAAGAAAAAATTDDRLFTIICNLDCVSLTGWKRIVSYIARKERTDVISLISRGLAPRDECAAAECDVNTNTKADLNYRRGRRTYQSRPPQRPPLVARLRSR